MLKLHERENTDLYKNDVSFNVTDPKYSASTNTLNADQSLKPIGESFSSSDILISANKQFIAKITTRRWQSLCLSL